MPLRFAQRREAEVPQPNRQGKVNEDLYRIRDELAKLAGGMVLEIETGSAEAIRRTKGLVTRASKELGRPIQHWHEGTKVFARPAEAVRRRGRPRKTDQPQ